jgi:pimeloyl-ACP methyl ester carboxylesterase
MMEPTRPESRWIERGAGEPVLLLHGLLGDMYHWEASLEGLAPECRPMALTLPIFAPALEAPSIPALGRHVTRFLDALGIARVVLGGNSLGGHVALHVALAHPERVAGLILTGSSGLFERGIAGRAPHRPSSACVRARMEEAFYDTSVVTPAWVEAVRRLVTDRDTALRVLRFAKAAKRDNVEGRLGEIHVPTLIVWGQEDRITPLDAGQRFHTLIADSQFWVLTRCGHAPMLEQPHAFNAIVREWLHESWPRRAQLVSAGPTMIARARTAC